MTFVPCTNKLDWLWGKIFFRKCYVNVLFTQMTPLLPKALETEKLYRPLSAWSFCGAWNSVGHIPVPTFWRPHLEKWNFSVPYCSTKMDFYKVLTYQEEKLNHCLIFRDTFWEQYMLLARFTAFIKLTYILGALYLYAIILIICD